MGRYCVKVTVRNGGGGRKNKKFSRSTMERRNTLPGRKSNSPCGEFRSRKENHSDATFAPVACIRSLRRGQNTRRCFPFRKFSKLSPVQTGIFLFPLDVRARRFFIRRTSLHEVDEKKGKRVWNSFNFFVSTPIAV